MPATYPARTITVSIERPPDVVYAYAVEPENLPAWVTSFARSVRREGERWLVETADGTVDFEFVARNDLGVLDHTVRAPGLEVRNPMRVVANGEGSEVMFTLYRLPDVTGEAYERDAAMVQADLERLKALLEVR